MIRNTGNGPIAEIIRPCGTGRVTYSCTQGGSQKARTALGYFRPSLRDSLRKPISAALLLMTIAAAPAALAQSQADGDRAHQVGAKLKCMCGGCAQSAGGCYHTGGAFSGPCDTAKGMLREVSTRAASGESDQQILAYFEKQYGMEVFMEPPKHGFSLLAWIMPVLYLVVGTAVVVFVISRWSKRPATEAVGTAGPVGISAEHLARARAQAARETDD